MVNCVYVGGEASEIGDREFDAVGQKAQFSESGFVDAVLGGAAFLPESEFNRIGMTAEEIRKYGPAGERDNPPGSFIAKLSRAHEVYRNLRSQIQADTNKVLEFSS